MIEEPGQEALGSRIARLMSYVQEHNSPLNAEQMRMRGIHAEISRGTHDRTGGPTYARFSIPHEKKQEFRKLIRILGIKAAKTPRQENGTRTHTFFHFKQEDLVEAIRTYSARK